MTELANLEARLRESWDRAHLAVYADALLEVGDPRGELIAIDLELAQRADDALVARRAALLDDLLGASVAAWFRRDRKSHFEYGFGDVRIDSVGGAGRDAERALLAGPLGGYLRRVRIGGGEKHLQAGVSTLASRTHPWLATLAIHYDTMASRAREPIVGPRAVAALIAATPALATLELTRSTTTPEAEARPMFSRFDHPNQPAIRGR